jgi:hypothetical protein
MKTGEIQSAMQALDVLSHISPAEHPAVGAHPPLMHCSRWPAPASAQRIWLSSAQASLVSAIAIPAVPAIPTLPVAAEPPFTAPGSLSPMPADLPLGPDPSAFTPPSSVDI